MIEYESGEGLILYHCLYLLLLVEKYEGKLSSV